RQVAPRDTIRRHRPKPVGPASYTQCTCQPSLTQRAIVASNVSAFIASAGLGPSPATNRVTTCFSFAVSIPTKTSFETAAIACVAGAVLLLPTLTASLLLL